MPLPLWPLERFLKAVPDAAHARLLCRAANHLLRGQPAAARLDALEGRHLCLACTDTGNSLRIRIEGRRLVPDATGQAWDVRIEGRLADLLLLATRSEDPDTLFFNRRLSLEGDTEAGLYVKNLLDALDFDWDAHLAAVLGPRRAARLLGLLRRSGAEPRLQSLAGRLQALVAASARPAG